MADLTPGTPEYKEAYDKEMQRLEAEATKEPEKKPAKEVETTSKADDKADDKPAEKTVEAKTEADGETKARLERVEKALKDTQRWGHENAAEVKRLKKEAEDRKHAEKRPAILDANEGLEDAIKHVAGSREKTEDPKVVWFSSVSRAIPDVDALLGDQAFYAKAQQRKAEIGAEWDDPLIAIRELSSMRTEHLTQKNVQVAVEAARKDFDEKSQKRNAMKVPGGSGGRDTPTKEDDVTRWQTMSSEEFAKARSKVMGY
jgi:hypothetical protein